MSGKDHDGKTRHVIVAVLLGGTGSYVISMALDNISSHKVTLGCIGKPHIS